MAPPREAIDVEGVRITSPDKVLYPEQGITKRALAAYYLAVADRILPHIAGRPITLVRCPTGRQKKCFYQRHAGSGVPEELDQVEIKGFEESGAYLFITDVPGLLALVQMGVLEIHPWGARTDRPDRPDRVIFDLDPGETVTFPEVVAAAHAVRGALNDRGLESFVKTTGGKGLHVVVPIERRHEWPEVKGFAKSVAEALAGAAPERYLTRMSKAERRGRILIDYLRNDATSTAVAPYSTRARAGAPVATPLAWSEVSADLDPARFNVHSLPERILRTADPWEAMPCTPQRLPRS